MIQKSTSLEYEPSLELLRITAEQLWSSSLCQQARLLAVEGLVNRCPNPDPEFWKLQGYLAHKKQFPLKALQ